ncbi:MAG: sigma-70 family RNA polymerase sigma factor [Planctomycetota bacterium]
MQPPESMPLSEPVPFADSVQQLEQHQGFVRGLARTLLTDESLVDEVVQRAYLAALRSPPDQPGRFRGWVSVVVRNTARTILRDEGRRVAREKRAARTEMAPIAPDPCEVAELRTFLAEAVLALREPYRSTVTLYYYQELDSVQIGALQGVPANTVRVRLRRALEQLRERLQSHDDDRRKVGACLLGLAGIPGFGSAAAAAVADSSSAATTPAMAARRPVASRSSRVAGTVGIAVVAALLLVGLPMWMGGDDGTPLPADLTAQHTASPDSVGAGSTAATGQSALARDAVAVPATATAMGQARPAALGPDVSTVRVIDALTRLPVASAQVCLSPQELSSRRLSQGRRAADLLLQPFCEGELRRVSKDGEILVAAQQLARERLLVRAPGYREHRELARFRAFDSVYTVALEPAPRVVVQVQRDQEVAAVDTVVQVHGSHGLHSTGVVDERGEWSFAWDEGDFLVQAQAPGCADVRALATAPVTRVRLPLGASGIGRVVAADGIGIAGAELEFRWSLWAGTPWKTMSAADGSFVTPNLPNAGKLSVTATHPEYESRAREVTLPWGGDNELTLARGGTVAGRIVGPRGRPAVGVHVRLLPGGRFRARNLHAAETGFDGTFRLTGVAPGKYALGVCHDEFWLEEQSVTVAVDRPLQLSLQLRYGQSMHGWVMTPEGAPAVAVRLRLGRICGDELWGSTTVTDQAGRFSFANAPLAPYPVRAAVRDIAWSALYGADKTLPSHGLVLRVEGPDQLVSCDGVAVPSHGLLGSRNTCPAPLRAEPLQLTVAPGEPRERLQVRLSDVDGVPVRTVTNLLLFPPEDPLAGAVGVFAGSDGQPLNLSDRSALDGWCAVFATRTHAYGFAAFAKKPYEQLHVVLQERRERALQLLAADDAVLAEVPVFAAPAAWAEEQLEPPVALYLGVTDRAGSLTVEFLPGGSYFLYRAASAPAKLRSGHSCLATTELQFLRRIDVDSRQLGVTVRVADN